MGAAGSSNSMPQPPSSIHSIPSSGRNEEKFTYGAGEPYAPENTNESIRRRTRIDTHGLTELPRSSQGQNATLRGDDWLNQRPSAPSISSLRNSQRDTLLTYATQMTGWQTADSNAPSSSQHQEVMELSRIISQLAIANQQLASAHSATLAHLESIYVELKKERECARRTVVSFAGDRHDESLRKRLTNTEDDADTEEKQKLELRIGKLENQMMENTKTCPSRQRSSRREEDRKLRSRIERLENSMSSQVLEKEDEHSRHRKSCYRVNDDDYSMENQSFSTTESRLPDFFDTAHDEIFRGTDHEVPEQKRLDEDLAKSIQKIYITRSDELKTKNLMDSGETVRSKLNLHLETLDEAKVVDGEEQASGMERNEMVLLREKIERLKAERLEYQGRNKRLLNDLEGQRLTIEKLTKNCEVQHEEAESKLRESEEKCDKLMKEFVNAGKKTEELLKDINTFNLEKDTAVTTISNLKEDLLKLQIEKEEIKNRENEKNSKLRAQLSQEISEKKKQTKALEDAMEEIQRLKETIKTDRQNIDDGALKEDIIDRIAAMDDTNESTPSNSASNIEEFKKELSVKREARQRAIAAVSSEMERLRRELDAEKEAHSETSKVLDILRSAQNNSQTQNLAMEVEENFKKSRIKDLTPDENDVSLKRTESQRLTDILKVSDELRNNVRFQIEKVDDLRYHLEVVPDQHQRRIRCLTEVTSRAREALHARERQSNELKDHLAQILVRLGDRSFLDIKDNVGLECERQLDSINSLKSLYNERLKVLTELREATVKELVDVKARLDHSLKKSECLEEDLKKADEKVDAQDTEISNLESQLGLTKADCRDLQNQMSLINGLFTQMLLGASSADMDLDRLTQLLQENHDLISDIARVEGTEAAALPKLLLDLIEQVEGSKGPQKRVEKENNGADGECEKKEDDLQQDDIAHNLPKVWRVLLELLSCHAEGAPSASAISSSDPNGCYKSVDTPAGPRLVISVSKTYIRLKELILEKKHLEKEMNRMKQLNTHLEGKLGEQEKRLSTVSTELSKTWNIVDRMQAQHQQLHTHEQILRYELQEKRTMLQELKQELEYCREKWESARQKNTNTELEWRSLRREFAARKVLAAQDSFNNSAESGFSDERGDDTDEEDNAVEGRIRLGPRRKPRKESPRAPTPDTESEQPTDTELSEPKTGSSATLGQRTPTPETETELDEIESTDMTDAVLISEGSEESLDPLDEALTNVIENLIGMDERIDSSATSSTFIGPNNAEEVTESITLILKDVDSLSSLKEEPGEIDSTSKVKSHCSTQGSKFSEESNYSKVFSISNNNEQDEVPSNIREDPKKILDTDGEKVKTEESLKSSSSHVPTVTSTVSTKPVFSIGPFPSPIVISSIIKSVQFSEPLIVGPSNRLSAPVFGSSDVEETLDSALVSPSLESTSLALSPANNSDPESGKLLDKRASRSMENVADSDNVSVGSSSSLETVKEFSPVDVPSASVVCESKNADLSEASSSTKHADSKVPTGRTRTPEEALAAREDRLKRLEEQAEWLMKKMNATSRRGSALSTRLEELHEVYKEPPIPPPMPDVLPGRRLRTNLTDLSRQVAETSSDDTTENIEKSTSGKNSNEPFPDSAR